MDGQAVTFVPGLRVGKRARVWEWQQAASKDAAFCVQCYTGLASPLLVPVGTRASPHGSDPAHPRPTCLPGQKKLKGLLAPTFPGSQLLRPPHTASVLAAPEISPVSSLDTEKINFASCIFIVFDHSTSRHRRTDAVIPVCITTDLNVWIQASDLTCYDLFMEMPIIYCFPIPEKESSARGWQTLWEEKCKREGFFIIRQPDWL